MQTIHPSIFPYPLNPNKDGGGGGRGTGAYPRCHWRRNKVHPEQVTSPSQGHTEKNEINNLHTHTLTARVNLEIPINLICMYFDDGRKLEYSEIHCRPKASN